MFVQEIWRYPVKSMAGELRPFTQLTEQGIPGDRVLQVRDLQGRILTSRTHPGLLGLHATTGQGGVVLVEELLWDDARISEKVRAIAGPSARIVRDEGLDRFDILPLLVATDGAISAFGRDRRRLRPNLVIGGVDGLDERTWEGHRLVIGDAVIQVQDLRGRCVMTTVDPDTQKQDPNVLRDIVKRFGGKLALNCDVIHGGRIEVGQEVTLQRM